jgi:hypothetical protein
LELADLFPDRLLHAHRDCCADVLPASLLYVKNVVYHIQIDMIATYLGDAATSIGLRV